MHARRSSSASPVGGLIAACVLGLLVLQVIEAQFSAGRSIGIGFEERDGGLVVSEVRPGGPAEVAGLLAGDRLETVAGRPVAGFRDYDRAARAFQRGEPVLFQTRRQGVGREATVRPGVSFPWTDFGFSLPTALAHLALGLLAFAQRPRDVRASLLASLSFAVALELALPNGLVGTPRLQTAVGLAFIVLTGLQMGLELHLASVIPEPRAWLARWPRLTWLYYLLGLGFAAPALAGELADALQLKALPWSGADGLSLLFQVGLPLWGLGVLALLGTAAWRHPEPTGRHQAGLVFIGTLPWAAVIVATSLAELAGLSLSSGFARLETLTLLCYPVATFIAIFRYHLFDIEVVVKRSLVYGTLTLSLLLFFYAAVGVGGALLSRRAGSGSSVWAVAVATLVMGLLFSPLREGVQRLIDRHFFPERAALRQELAELASRLPSLGSLPSMGQELAARLCDVLALRGATLLLADPDSGVLAPLASHGIVPDERGRPALIGPEDPAAAVLRDARRPVKARHLRAFGSRLHEVLARSGTDLLVPIVRQGELVGLLLLARKTNGDDFAVEELELLSLLSHHIATVFENARLFESATRDSLTGLLRREAALEELASELRRAHRFRRPLTVAMADLDFFKTVNDRYGHLAGDLTLRRVAQVMTRGLRGSDLVGRYGGEEFLIMLPETDLAGAIRGAEKVRALVEGLQVELEDGRQVSVTVSIGLAALDEVSGSESDPPPTAADLIAAADVRLYQAKNGGRNRVEPREGVRPAPLPGRLLPRLRANRLG